MKIYQVIEFDGEYEWVLKTYLSKEKALNYKELLQKKFEEDEELFNKCLYIYKDVYGYKVIEHEVEDGE